MSNRVASPTFDLSSTIVHRLDFLRLFKTRIVPAATLAGEGYRNRVCAAINNLNSFFHIHHRYRFILCYLSQARRHMHRKCKRAGEEGTCVYAKPGTGTESEIRLQREKKIKKRNQCLLLFFSLLFLKNQKL